MSLERLEHAFAERPRHVAPFLVLGDPDPETSVALALRAVEEGATMLELGIPYSDPCADGPRIQEACARALAAGTTVDAAFEALAAIHRGAPQVPLNLLVYGNLVHAAGYDGFCARAAAAGAASLLVPDVPLEECAALRSACAEHDLGHVQLVAPNTAADRLPRIAEAATGFLYLAAVQGVTGSAASPAATRRALIERVRTSSTLPRCLGFGLSDPAHLREAFDAGAEACVVGSALAAVIGDAHARGDARDRVVDAFAAAFHPLAATAGD